MTSTSLIHMRCVPLSWIPMRTQVCVCRFLFGILSSALALLVQLFS